MPITNTLATLSARGFGYGTEDAFGERVFTSPGTYSFLVPVGVTSVSMVAVGGGGAGCQAIRYLDSFTPSSIVTVTTPGTTVYAGGGGALAYSNAVSVTPGETLTVYVGNGGSSSQPTSVNPSQGFGTAGEGSYVLRGPSTYLVSAGGGANGQTGAGGSVVIGTGYTGGQGGQSAWDNNYGTFIAGGGGGGAAGYSGIGGAGGNAGQTGGSGSSGVGGGAGGAGAGGLAEYTAGSAFYALYQGGAGGGGVGLNGQGANGAGGTGMIPNGTFNYTNAFGGGGGSSGAAGEDGGLGSIPSSGQGGAYGGGGGAGGSRYRDIGGVFTYVGYSANNGRNGAVRIIWTTNQAVTRAFPSTNVGPL